MPENVLELFRRLYDITVEREGVFPWQVTEGWDIYSTGKGVLEQGRRPRGRQAWWLIVGKRKVWRGYRNWRRDILGAE